MDFDLLDRALLDSSRAAILQFKHAIEGTKPTDQEVKSLAGRIRPYRHTTTLEQDFRICAVDGSGEFPILQQDDVFVHFATAAGVTYDTQSKRQSKMVAVGGLGPLLKRHAVLQDQPKALTDAYKKYLESLVGLGLKELLEGSDYCSVYSQFGKSLKSSQVTWDNFAISHASQVATHAYLLRSLAELGMAIRLLEQKPKYLVMDTSLVYFLLGDSPYLPELLKRYLITKANAQDTAIVALCKSHNIPNGDFIGRMARDKHGLKSHWFLRLPSEALGDAPLSFLQDREIPPKLSVSYLFKFEATSFPMRVDVDAAWWSARLAGDEAKERRFFEDLDYTCHEVRSYGYPYPMHAAHRRASLTKLERKAARDLLLQYAQQEGLLRGAFLEDPERVHMTGI
jgi:hypothetical protein